MNWKAICFKLGLLMLSYLRLMSGVWVEIVLSKIGCIILMHQEKIIKKNSSLCKIHKYIWSQWDRNLLSWKSVRCDLFRARFCEQIVQVHRVARKQQHMRTRCKDETLSRNSNTWRRYDSWLIMERLLGW